MDLMNIENTVLSDSEAHLMHCGQGENPRYQITCATLRPNTGVSLRNECEQTLSHASSQTVGMLLTAVSRKAREAHERLRKNNAMTQGRVHRISVGILTKAFDETGCPLSDEEITLMHRYGNEPFSWEE